MPQQVPLKQILLLLLSCTVHVQQGTAQTQLPELNLSSDLTTPGGESFLYLTWSSYGARVGKVISKVSFPKGILTFMESKSGEAAERASAEVKTSLKQDTADAELALLEVSISAPNGLADGTLTTLKFTVAQSAPETDVNLINAVKAFSPDGQQVSARGNVAVLTISPAKLPQVGCFFFAH
ncbi:MAG TPA: hypothetical protein VNJ09_03705 [Chthonomonadales bacterium]|nr:hypothetical protein [Chthonomonadales bacterium]